MTDEQRDNGVRVVRMPTDVRSLSLSVLAVIAAVLMLQYAQSVCIPIVLGVLLAYALEPFVKALCRLRLPRSFGAGVAVTLLVFAVGIGTYTLSDQAMTMLTNVPEAARHIRDRLRERRHKPDSAIQKVQRAASEI